MPTPRILGGCLLLSLLWAGGGLLLLWLLSWMVVDSCGGNASWSCSPIVNGHATLHAACALAALTAAILWWINHPPADGDNP